MLDVKLVPMRG